MSHICEKCAKQELCCYNEQTISQLESRQLCFSCNWYWRFLNDPIQEEHHHHHSTAVVIDGQIYTDSGSIAKPDPRGYGVGHGGRKFHIRMLDGSREWSTNNLWSGGRIPEIWASEIPNTAEFFAGPA